jgi:hypothetical protein
VAWPAPGELSVVQVTDVMQGSVCESISRAWACCIGQVAVDVRASALVALGLQQTLPQQTGLCVCQCDWLIVVAGASGCDVLLCAEMGGSV